MKHQNELVKCSGFTKSGVKCKKLIPNISFNSSRARLCQSCRKDYYERVYGEKEYIKVEIIKGLSPIEKKIVEEYNKLNKKTIISLAIATNKSVNCLKVYLSKMRKKGQIIPIQKRNSEKALVY